MSDPKIQTPNPFLTKIGQTVPMLVDSNNPIGYCVSSLLEFAVDSKRFLTVCTKPDQKEFKKICSACAMGFLIMGFIGYVVKLVFIPINNILVGMGM